MAEPFLAEIRIVSFNFAPRGWAFCNGQLLPINQNQALFSLLGTTYGGDGRVNFALPELRGRTASHVSGAHPLGQRSGEESHTLSIAEMPQHTHFQAATSQSANQATPGGNVLASTASNIYGSPSGVGALNAGSITNTGGSQAHENMQPYLTLNFCIALQGIFPSPN